MSRLCVCMSTLLWENLTGNERASDDEEVDPFVVLCDVCDVARWNECYRFTATFLFTFRGDECGCDGNSKCNFHL